MVLFTGGRSADENATMAAAKRLHGQGVEVYVVAAEIDHSEKELSEMASDPDCQHLNRLHFFHEMRFYSSNVLVCQSRWQRVLLESATIRNKKT